MLNLIDENNVQYTGILGNVNFISTRSYGKPVRKTSSIKFDMSDGVMLYNESKSTIKKLTEK